MFGVVINHVHCITHRATEKQVNPCFFVCSLHISREWCHVIQIKMVPTSSLHKSDPSFRKTKSLAALTQKPIFLDVSGNILRIFVVPPSRWTMWIMLTHHCSHSWDKCILGISEIRSPDHNHMSLNNRLADGV